MSGPLAGKTALITGAGSGLGRVAALAFARAGAAVMLADRDAEGGEATRRLLAAEGASARYVKADVTKPAEVAAMVEAAVGAFGRLDCALNNAGILGSAFVPTADYPEDVWNAVIAVNLTGVWSCMKSEIRQMLKQGGGAIVNMASVAGLIGSRVGSAYAASKHGVVGLTKSAALEYGPVGIRVNALCPSWIDTALTEQVSRTRPDILAGLVGRQPTGRLCTPEEVAAAAVFLASDAASFITGHALPVDGGVVIQ